MRSILVSNCKNLLALLFGLSLLAGCASDRVGELSKQAAEKAEVANFGNDFIRMWGDATDKELSQYPFNRRPPLALTQRRSGKPVQNFLAISGGGSNGAFGAGVLNGWTKSGTRPKFHVVTGVSTGALIAPFAYLGPKYDYLLTEFYTQTTTRDILVPNIFGPMALADSRPLKKLIDKYMSREVMEEIAKEHRKRRFLFIGTTNLDSQRPVIWNIGQIATIGTDDALELIRNVLLASAAIPGAFPPVLIDVSINTESGTELHVDGGTTNNVFLMPPHFNLQQIDRRYKRVPDRNLFVLVNSNLRPEYEAVKPSTLKIGARAISTLIKQQTSGDVLELYTLAKKYHMNFRYADIPNSFDVKAEELFDQKQMRALYKVGVEFGSHPNNWSRRPDED